MAYENKIKAIIDNIVENNIINKEVVTVLDFDNNGKYKILPDKENIELDSYSFRKEMNKNYKTYKKIIELSLHYEIEDFTFDEECLKINFLPNKELVNKIYFCLFKEIKKKEKSETNNTYIYVFFILSIICGIYYVYYNDRNTIKIN